jgi:hypothetical protein
MERLPINILCEVLEWQKDKVYFNSYQGEGFFLFGFLSHVNL